MAAWICTWSIHFLERPRLLCRLTTVPYSYHVLFIHQQLLYLGKSWRPRDPFFQSIRPGNIVSAHPRPPEKLGQQSSCLAPDLLVAIVYSPDLVSGWSWLVITKYHWCSSSVRLCTSCMVMLVVMVVVILYWIQLVISLSFQCSGFKLEVRRMSVILNTLVVRMWSWRQCCLSEKYSTHLTMKQQHA